MSNLELRPRLGSEIVDAAFQLYRRHFSRLITLCAILFAPLVLLQLLLAGGAPSAATAPIAVIVLDLLAWLTSSVTDAAMVLAVSNSYLHGDPDIAGALRLTFSRLGTILLAVWGKWFLIGLGFMVALIGGLIAAAIAFATAADIGGGAAGALVGVALVAVIGVPVGAYMYARYFAVPATVVLEGTGARAGLHRSTELSAGLKMKVLGTLGLPVLALVVVQLITLGVLLALGLPRVLAFLVQQGISVLAYPVIAVISTLLYYDARIRKEGFDIEVMAAELGAPAGAAPAPGPPPAGAE